MTNNTVNMSNVITVDSPSGQAPGDRLGRPLADLRISVMDRCNFRCPYCMPEDKYHKDFQFLDSRERLSFDEIHRVARIFAGLGVRKLRITGGEPLLRPGLPDLIGDLTGIDGIGDIALTTNGILLASACRGAEGRRTGQGHGQPRFDGRRSVRADERRPRQ